MHPRTTLLAGLAVACLGQVSSAALIAYEGFAVPGDYADGQNLDGTATTTGDGWTGGWFKKTGSDDALLADDVSLTYSNLVTTPGSALNPDSPSAADRADAYYRSFDFGTTFQPGDDYWISALFNRTTGGNNWTITLVDTDTPDTLAARNGVGFGDSNDGLNAFIQTQDGQDDLAVANGQTHFVVARVSLDDTVVTDDPTVDVWLNPGLNDDLASVAVGGGDASFSRGFFGAPDVDLLAVYSHQSNEINLDEIRVGLNQGEVMPVPEPGSVALVGAGAALMLARRRCG